MGLSCEYCSVAPEEAWVCTEFVVAVPHPSPTGLGHLVVAPRRHVAAFYDLDVQEQRMIWDALARLRQRIAATLDVEGFDAGFVDAPTGESDFHTHIHLIPRIAGQKVELPVTAEWVYLGSEV